ncbi:MAG: crosslink repair DNA glycosylase YcaQ family protein [Desulfosarcinaceae bacterium]|jgi:uncharacterized protein YcaQ
MKTLDLTQVRRLALARAGLLKPEWTGMPRRASGLTRRARRAALRVIQRFGYLQLDTVAVAGARSHAIVLLSRLEGFDPALAEILLQCGEPLFEYWGHEACWLPIDLYPVFAFRRQEFQHHPWWGDLIGKHPRMAANLTERIRKDGPLRSLDLEGRGSRGWWDLKITKRMATALWSAGILAIRERSNFQRVYDLTERVIPERWRVEELTRDDALERLLLIGLQGHGWATTGTLTQTWRLRKTGESIRAALARLRAKGAIVACSLVEDGGRPTPGWIRPQDLELAERLQRVRPRKDRGVLLSPFDPALWDRARVRRLFGFDQVLEIFKPAHKRVYGYYCLPVLAGEKLVARVDLKAVRKTRKLHVLSNRFEADDTQKKVPPADRKALRSAVRRYAAAIGMQPVGLPK